MKVAPKTCIPKDSCHLPESVQEDFLLALSTSDIAGMKKYLDGGGDLNKKIPTKRWPSGADALTVACVRNNTESVRWLLENGADPNQVKLNGDPILFRVMSMSQFAIFADMVKYWDISLRDKHGFSFLEMADMCSVLPYGKEMQKMARLRVQQLEHNSNRNRDLVVYKKQKLSALNDFLTERG